MKFKYIIPFLSFILLANVAYGQKTWTLQECILHAQEKNIFIEQAQLQEKSSDIDLQQAKKSRLPNLSGDVSAGLNFGRTIDPTSNEFITKSFLSNNFGLSSGVLLYNGNRISNTIKQSELQRKSASLSTKDQSYNLALQVASLFLNVLFSEENEKLAALQINSATEQLENLRKLIAAGATPRNDQLELEALLAQRNQDALLAANNTAMAKLQLAQLMQLDDLSIQIDPSANIDALLDPNQIDFNEYLQQLIANDPNTEIAQIQLASSALNEEIIASSYYPTLSLGGNIRTAYSNQARDIDGFDTDFVDQTVIINGAPVTVGFPNLTPVLIDIPYGNQITDNISYGLGLGLAIPIYSNYQVKGNVEKAKLNTKNQALMYEQHIRDLTLTAQQSLLEAKYAKEKYETSQLVEEAQKASYDNAVKKHQIGALNSLELVSANIQWQQSSFNTLLAKYDYIFKVKVLDYYLGNY